MPTEKKAKTIANLQETFAKSSGGVLADYRGLKTAELVALRRKLKAAGVELKVIKNTLARIASKNAGKDALPVALDGPMAIIFGYGDVAQPAKIVTEHIAAAKLALTIKGGFLGNKLLTAKEVIALAALPSREVLLAKIMGGVQSPLYAFMGQLNAPLRGFMTILQARTKQLEGVK